MMASFTIKGAVAPVFTPMKEDSTIDYDTITKYASFLADQRIRAVLDVSNPSGLVCVAYLIEGQIMAGTSGEGMSLKVEERKRLAEVWIREARSRDIQVIVQVGGAPLPDVLELAKHAERIQADAILTLPELYFKPSAAEDLVVYLQDVSRAAPSLPLLYYHFPAMSGVDVDVKEFFKLAVARIPKFKGMKSDLGAALKVVDHLTEDRVVFIGNHLIAPAALLNQESSIATVTNLFPSLVTEILDSVRSSDLKQTRVQQVKMNRLVDGIACQGSWVPAMKYAMELVTGMRVGSPRPPLRPLNEDQKATIRRNLRDLCVDIIN